MKKLCDVVGRIDDRVVVKDSSLEMTSVNLVVFLVISFEAKLTLSFVKCPPPQSNCGNNTQINNSRVIDIIDCDLLNISCGSGKVCRQGHCVYVESKSDSQEGQIPSTDVSMEYKTVAETTVSTGSNGIGKPTSTSHSLLSGNQEFAIALVGFSILFINFCLISFCLARAKQRRNQQRRSATTQGSQTGEDYWNESHLTGHDTSQVELNMGIDNFALNGDLDGFSNGFYVPHARLPPYDFYSAYDKPRPRSEEGEDDEEAFEPPPDTQSINEEPPPYSDQRYGNTSNPPSYEDVLKVAVSNIEESSSGL